MKNLYNLEKSYDPEPINRITFSVTEALKNVVFMIIKTFYNRFLHKKGALIPKTSKTVFISIIQKFVFDSKANVVYIFELVINSCPHTYV